MYGGYQVVCKLSGGGVELTACHLKVWVTWSLNERLRVIHGCNYVLVLGMFMCPLY